MEIVAGHDALTSLPTDRRPRAPAVAIGNFDGVHLGHRRLFDEVRRRAQATGGASVVLSFEPHPAKVLNPALAPRLIATPERKRELVAAAGIDVLLLEPFDRALAGLPPTEFVERVIVRALGAKHVCVGFDFTFGKGRAGTTALLEELGRAHGFGVTVVPAVTVEGIVCSSTKVREFVLAGRVDGAALLLGRDPEVEGTVVTGAGRGRTIGVPTANLAPSTELLPAPGVYAGWAEPARATAEPSFPRHRAAINIGTNPTFTAGTAGAPVTVEAHLLDYAGPPLVGATVRLGFRRRLRAEQKFPTVEALVARIRQDIEATRHEALPSPSEIRVP